MLVSPKNSFQGQGLRSPEDFYWVIQDPVPLAGMCLQETNWPWQSICDCGFTNLISLHPMDLVSMEPSEIELIAANKSSSFVT